MSFARGSVLHIADFPGDYGPCDKYVFVMGHTAPQKILVFTISSQSKYTLQTRYSREMVSLPLGTSRALNKASWIQCFHHPTELRTDIYQINLVDTLSETFIASARAVIENSDILTRFEIDDCLDVMKDISSSQDDG